MQVLRLPARLMNSGCFMALWNAALSLITTSGGVPAGATTPNAPMDHGFMYQHGFADLDGHQWEVFHMDMSVVPPQL